MCGFAGYWQNNQLNALELGSQVERMTDTLVHRGPDDSGSWTEPPSGLALGFRRLAIVDLTKEGHQPMHSESGRYVIVFNGEVYNFLDLRRELERSGHKFRGHSDTEVMLAAIEEWGPEAATKKFIGMFAFALWDRVEKRLALVRDRLGIKPLYYGWMGHTFLFGSELKALRAHPTFRAEVDRSALSLFMRHGAVPAPFSIYKNVFQLPPGCILNVGCRDGSRSMPVAFWSAKEVAQRGIAHPFASTETEAIEQLEGLLREAVGLRMIADVPLGAFLSGGVDSSTVVALMQAQSTKPIKTFSIGFNETGYNEAVQAKAVAQHLKTDHTELYVTSEQAQAVIPKLPSIYDEPFADSSQIPTFLVSELARSKVTVSLSGDGGDEVFGGYPRYFAGTAIWGKLRMMPLLLRQGMSAGIRSMGPRFYDKWLGWMSPYTGSFGMQGAVGHKLHVLSEMLDVQHEKALYHRLVSHWKTPAEVVIGGYEPSTVLTDPNRWADGSSFFEHMMYCDTVSYLPDDIFTKVDRASMAVSLEARVPLLDHRVVEFAWTLPLSLKSRNGEGKWLLKEVLYKYVPKALIDRPKMGFGVPIDTWLRGPLRDWAESLINEARLNREGYFHPKPIREKWAQHLSGDRNWHFYLWDVLMFQAWLERWG